MQMEGLAQGCPPGGAEWGPNPPCWQGPCSLAKAKAGPWLLPTH